MVALASRVGMAEKALYTGYPGPKVGPWPQGSSPIFILLSRSWWVPEEHRQDVGGGLLGWGFCDQMLSLPAALFTSPEALTSFESKQKSLLAGGLSLMEERGKGVWDSFTLESDLGFTFSTL